jgi:hypothetical protein
MSRYADPSVPRNYMEKYFLYKLRLSNLPKPAIRRSDWGMMVAAWQSPNPAVGEFWANIYSRAEVAVGCLLSHHHCTGVEDHLWKNYTERRLKRMSVIEALVFVEMFLTDHIVVSYCEDEQNQRRCSGWDPNLPSRETCSLDDQKMESILKGKIRQYRHTWSGPYEPSA